MRSWVYRFENGTLYMTCRRVENLEYLLVFEGTEDECFSYVDEHAYKGGE